MQTEFSGPLDAHGFPGYYGTMTFDVILSIAQLSVALLLGVAILLQQQSGGLSPAFGQEGGFYRTRRGIEKILFRATVILAILFIGLALVSVFIR